MKIIGANERLTEPRSAKILIVGPSGVGKTSLLRSLDQAMLSSTLFVDIEAGDIAVADLPVASIRPRRWGFYSSSLTRPVSIGRSRLPSGRARRWWSF